MSAPRATVAANTAEPEPQEPSEEAIRLRSRQIWESEGRPEGRAEEHWLRAKAELDELMARTSNEHLAAPVCRENDTEHSLLDQAGTMMPKPPRPAAHFAVPRFSARAEHSKQSSVAPSIICANMVFRGTLESTGDIHLDGRVEGDFCCPCLVIGEEGVVRGEVMADDVTVRGRIEGRLCARTVRLCSGSRVEGDILYEILEVELGAQLDGNFLRLEDSRLREHVPEDDGAAGTPSREEPLSQAAA